MKKTVKICGIIGIIIFIISMFSGLIGWYFNIKDLFYTGCSLVFFVMPIWVVVFLLIVFISIIKNKNKDGNSPSDKN